MQTNELRKETLRLIRNHCENNEVGFKNTALGIAKLLQANGYTEQALYILAQYKETETFITEEPHLNSRNLLERFVEKLENEVYTKGDKTTNTLISVFADVFRPLMHKVLNEFIESELNERKPE